MDGLGSSGLLSWLLSSWTFRTGVIDQIGQGGPRLYAARRWRRLPYRKFDPWLWTVGDTLTTCDHRHSASAHWTSTFVVSVGLTVNAGRVIVLSQAAARPVSGVVSNRCSLTIHTSSVVCCTDLSKFSVWSSLSSFAPCVPHWYVVVTLAGSTGREHTVISFGV